MGTRGVSTAKQDLDRQIDALQQAGIPGDRICVDKKSGATTDRTGMRAALEYARDGDVIVVHTPDRLGRTVRDTLNLIHQLSERGVGVRNLADTIRIDSTNPNDPMAQLALFAQMERTYAIERAAHARAVAIAKGRPIGRPTVVNPDQLDYARHLRDAEHSINEIVAKSRDLSHQPVPAPATPRTRAGHRGAGPRRRGLGGMTSAAEPVPLDTGDRVVAACDLGGFLRPRVRRGTPGRPQ